MPDSDTFYHEFPGNTQCNHKSPMLVHDSKSIRLHILGLFVYAVPCRLPNYNLLHDNNFRLYGNALSKCGLHGSLLCDKKWNHQII